MDGLTMKNWKDNLENYNIIIGINGSGSVVLFNGEICISIKV